MRKIELKQKAASLYNEGYSYMEVANELKISKSTAYRWVNEGDSCISIENEDGLELEKNSSDSNMVLNNSNLERNDNVFETGHNYSETKTAPESDESPKNLEFELKKAQMEHEFRMAQLHLEEKKLEQGSISEEIGFVEAKQPLDLEKIESNIVNKAVADFEAKQKEEQIKKNREKLLEKNKYTLSYNLRLSIEKFVSEFLNLNMRSVKKSEVDLLKCTLTRIKKQMRMESHLKNVAVSEFPQWKLLDEIGDNLAAMRSEIIKSLFGSCKFEFPRKWRKDLESSIKGKD